MYPLENGSFACEGTLNITDNCLGRAPAIRLKFRAHVGRAPIDDLFGCKFEQREGLRIKVDKFARRQIQYDNPFGGGLDNLSVSLFAQSKSILSILSFCDVLAERCHADYSPLDITQGGICPFHMSKLT
jgi:hypothetical protein